MLTLLIDMLLYGLFALTVTLISYKTWEFHAMKYGEDLDGKSIVQDARDSGVRAKVRLKNRVHAFYEQKEAFLPLIAVIATTAPFIGLAGTVYSIMQALGTLSGGNVDVAQIAGPVGRALTSTLWGLASAIPAAMSYNLFVRFLNKERNQALAFVDEQPGKEDLDAAAE